jgi:UrcA family protein
MALCAVCTTTRRLSGVIEEGNKMSKQFFYRVFFASLIALALPAATLAAAPSGHGDTALKVDFADLNIHSTAGARTLYARLQRASAKACDVRALREYTSIEHYVASKTCFEETLAAAVRKVESEALADLHANS